MKKRVIGAVAALLAAPAAGGAETIVTWTTPATLPMVIGIPAYDYHLGIPVDKEVRIVNTENSGEAETTVNGGPGSYTQESVVENPDGSVTSEAVAVATPPAS